MNGKWSRRGVVTAIAGTGAASIAGSGSAHSQGNETESPGGSPEESPDGDIAVRFLVAETDQASQFVEQDGYDGYQILIGDESTDELSPSDVKNCEFNNWPPEGIVAYDGRIIDRIDEQQPRAHETQIYAPSDTDVPIGSLWVINRVINCESGYLGFEAGLLSTEEATGTVPAETTETETFLPGFGPLPALAAVLAGGYALVRRSRRE